MDRGASGGYSPQGHKESDIIEHGTPRGTLKLTQHCNQLKYKTF